jgi:hypothetical protein
LYRCEESHANHQTDKSAIQKEVKSVIETLFKDGTTKPKAILRALKNRGIQEPEIKQLSNYLATLRKKLLGNPTISVGELEVWCNNKKVFTLINIYTL